LRLQANGGDVSAEHEIAEVHNRVDHALGQGDFAPEMLMLLARAGAEPAAVIRRLHPQVRSTGLQHAAAVPSEPAVVGSIVRSSGSHKTLCWRELDSNLRSRVWQPLRKLAFCRRGLASRGATDPAEMRITFWPR
jgi:hypothetical protein